MTSTLRRDDDPPLAACPTLQVSYNASGYGPYPFWTAGGGVGVLDGPGAAIRSDWSDVRNAERLEHASCDLAGVELTQQNASSAEYRYA